MLAEIIITLLCSFYTVMLHKSKRYCKLNIKCKQYSFVITQFYNIKQKQNANEAIRKRVA